MSPTLAAGVLGLPPPEAVAALLGDEGEAAEFEAWLRAVTLVDGSPRTPRHMAQQEVG